MHSSSASSDHRAANVLIMSSCSTKRGLHRLMMLYRSYYEQSRTHLSLDKDAPIPRPVMPASDGAIVVAVPEVGGLHHRTNAARPEHSWNHRLQLHERRSDCQTRPCCDQLSKQGRERPGTRSSWHSSNLTESMPASFDRTQDTARAAFRSPVGYGLAGRSTLWQTQLIFPREIGSPHWTISATGSSAKPRN
jgi:hypothetical protein